MKAAMFNTVSNKTGSIFAGNLSAMQKPALKSAQKKAERQQKAAGQIDFWEKQKANLKNMECATLEDIARKLDKFHTYEDEIAAVKMQYNQEQMWHVMDEAREMGEKIAEAAEKSKYKTAEERHEEMVEEALGTDEEKGMLDEIMEEMPTEDGLLEEVSQSTEEMMEEAAEIEKQDVSLQENPESTDALPEALSENALVKVQSLSQEILYKRIDLLV